MPVGGSGCRVQIDPPEGRVVIPFALLVQGVQGIIDEISPPRAGAPTRYQAGEPPVERQCMSARAGHLAVEHRPADVLDMNDGPVPVCRWQLVVRDLVAARAVAVHERVPPVAGPQVGPPPQPQPLVVPEELVDPHGELPAGQVRPVNGTRLRHPTADRPRTGKGRLVRAALGVRSKDDGRGLCSGFADHHLFRPPGVPALEPHLVSRLQVQPVHLAYCGEWLPFGQAVVCVIPERA